MTNNIPTNLQGIMDAIKAKWEFTPEKYPALANMNEKQRKVFICSHVILHMNKSLGVIAGVCESADHGEVNRINDQNPALNMALVKTLINTLVLMDLMNMTEQEIGEMIKIVLG